MNLVIFYLDNVRYAMDVVAVEEIIPLPAIISLTKIPTFVCGIINLRGSIIPIIDLKERLGLGKSGYELDNDVLIVKIHDKKAGLIVDDVLHVMDINENFIIPPPSVIDGIAARFMSAAARIGNDLLMILDLDHILTLDEKENFMGFQIGHEDVHLMKRNNRK